MKKILLHTFARPFAFYLVILFTFSSCEKEEVSPSENLPTCQVSKSSVAEIPDAHYTYQYDKNKRMTLASFYSQDKLRTSYAYTYNDKGQIVALTIKDKGMDRQGEYTLDYSEVYSFDYNGKSQLTGYYMQTLPPPGYNSNVRVKSVFEYDGEGNRTKETFVRSYEDRVIYGAEITYTYQNGNCIREIFGPGAPDGVTVEHEYYLDQENKQKTYATNHAFHKQLKPIQFYFNLSLKDIIGPTGSKNLIKSTVIKEDVARSQIDYSYEFDGQGFPIKQFVDDKTAYFYGKYTNLMEYNCQ